MQRLFPVPLCYYTIPLQISSKCKMLWNTHFAHVTYVQLESLAQMKESFLDRRISKEKEREKGAKSQLDIIYDCRFRLTVQGAFWTWFLDILFSIGPIVLNLNSVLTHKESSLSVRAFRKKYILFFATLCLSVCRVLSYPFFVPFSFFGSAPALFLYIWPGAAKQQRGLSSKFYN